MLHITNVQADELARTIELAVPLLRELAGHHARFGDAMTFIREYRIAQYHADHRELVLATIGMLDQATNALRERELPAPAAQRRVRPSVPRPRTPQASETAPAAKRRRRTAPG